VANNQGTTKTYPIIVINGPGNLQHIINRKTSEKIYFTGLALQEGEVVRLDLRPAQLTAVSTFRGDLMNYILPNSNFKTFHLEPGENPLSIMIDNPDATAAIFWIETFWSVDGDP